MSFQTMSFQTLSFQTMSFQTMSFHTMSFQTLYWPFLGDTHANIAPFTEMHRHARLCVQNIHR